jgi:hypothetical protein
MKLKVVPEPSEEDWFALNYRFLRFELLTLSLELNNDVRYDQKRSGLTLEQKISFLVRFFREARGP